MTRLEQKFLLAELGEVMEALLAIGHKGKVGQRRRQVQILEARRRIVALVALIESSGEVEIPLVHPSPKDS